MKSDKLLIFVFAIVGLAIALGLILLSIGGPDNSIVVVGANRLPNGSGEMHVWILERHVFSGPIASYEDFDTYGHWADLSAWAVVAIIGLLIGVCVGFLVSRLANRKRMRIVPRGASSAAK